MIEKIRYQCETCGLEHYSSECITTCKFCGKEICDDCGYIGSFADSSKDAKTSTSLCKDCYNKVESLKNALEKNEVKRESNETDILLALDAFIDDMFIINKGFVKKEYDFLALSSVKSLLYTVVSIYPQIKTYNTYKSIIKRFQEYALPIRN